MKRTKTEYVNNESIPVIIEITPNTFDALSLFLISSTPKKIVSTENKIIKSFIFYLMRKCKQIKLPTAIYEKAE
jgi:hypothetical protein